MENVRLKNYIIKALKLYLKVISFMALFVIGILIFIGLASLPFIFLQSYGKGYVVGGFVLVMLLYCPLVFCLVYHAMEYMDDKKDQLRQKQKETLYAIKQDQKSA